MKGNSYSNYLIRAAFALITIGFVIWSVLYIYTSSFIAIDGKRYFALYDDALISMRYAWNLSHGLGLVWNPGERVEGYTNPLMTLLMALLTLIFDKRIAVLAVQITGLVFLLGIACLSILIIDQASLSISNYRRRLLKVVTFLAILTFYPLVHMTLMGMEVGLLTFLLMLSVLLSLKYVRERKTVYLPALSVVMGLAYLTRPDAIILAALIFLFIYNDLFKSRRTRSDFLKVLGSVALFGTVIAVHLIFRWWYYGQLVPNTYTLKMMGVPLLARLENGIRYAAPFLGSIAIFLLVAIVSVIKRFKEWKLLFLSIAISLIIYQFWIGGDVFLHPRIIFPSVPLLIIIVVGEMLLVGESIVAKSSEASFLIRDRTLRPMIFLKGLPTGIIALAGMALIIIALTADGLGMGDQPGIGERQIKILIAGSMVLVTAFPSYRLVRRRHISVFLAAFFTLLMLGPTNVSFARHITLLYRPREYYFSEGQVNCAIAIDRLTSPSATVGVIAAGGVPYYTGRVAFDFLGKADPYIAALEPDLSGAVGWYRMYSVPGHNKYDLEYSIKGLRPTFVWSFYWGQQDLSSWAKDHYVDVDYKGRCLLHLLGESEDVAWDAIENLN